MAKTLMKHRVAALIARANDEAASEAEAKVCMEKAMDLMSKFGLTLDEITGDSAEQIGGSHTVWAAGRAGGAMVYVQGAIAAFTNTRVAYRGTVSVGTSTSYYGYSAERDLAVWLHGHIANAIRAESRNYDPGPRSASTRAKYRKSFAIAMASRIAERLFAMADTLDDDGRGTGTDVMVVKNQKLDEYYEGLGFKPARRTKQSLFAGGLDAGAAAGDNVSLHRPVDDGSADGPLLLAAQ